MTSNFKILNDIQWFERLSNFGNEGSKVTFQPLSVDNPQLFTYIISIIDSISHTSTVT